MTGNQQKSDGNGVALAMTPQAALAKANAMILQNIVDSKISRLLKMALRAQAADARAAGRVEEALELERVADELAVRYMPPPE